MFQHLARFCYRRRWLVVAGWLALLVSLGALGVLFGGEFRTEAALPGSESQRAFDLLEEHGFDDRAGEEGQIVFEADQGVLDPSVRAPMEAYFTAITSSDLDLILVSPYEDAGAGQISEDGQVAYATLMFADRPVEEYDHAATEIVALGNAAGVDGLRIEYGGWIFADESEPFSEFIGLIGAAVILLIAFGSLLAMGVPILTALFGIGTGASLAMLGTNLIGMPDFALAVAMMIGIGVGIDYALFILTRYRTALHDGYDPESATVLALDTSGRAVFFAGLTVMLAALGLITMNLDFISGIGLAIAGAVLMTMLAALTLLPALLGFIRERIDRFGLPHRKRVEAGSEGRFWQRWSGLIQRRPLAALIAGGAFLLILTIPLFGIQLGFSDAGTRPEEDTTRQAYDLLADGFGPGFNGPLLLVSELPGGEADVAALDALTTELRATDGVAAVSPVTVSPDGELAIIQLVPTTAPQDKETAELVYHLRDDVLPDAGTSSAVLVSGMKALEIDFSDYFIERTPLFFGVVLGVSFLLLLVVFRSILVPLKAVVMNMVSIGATFGILVAVFQWGWLGGWVGIDSVGPTEAWAPMMLFPIIFGLSMDYEVFLLSRIREEYDRSGDNASAVAQGLAGTARVITAAAAIMVVVFTALALSPDRSIQLLGAGLALAILIDATVVRLVLVPATMELLGDRNWWMPAWLERLVPVVHVESERAVAEAAPRRLPTPAEVVAD